MWGRAFRIGHFENSKMPPSGLNRYDVVSVIVKKTYYSITVLETLKVTAEHCYQTVVKLSESATLKTLTRHLAIEIAMTSFLS
jgi:hypothetical protein